MEKNTAYFDRFEQIRKLLYKNANSLRYTRYGYEPKEGLIGVRDIKDLDCQTAPALHEKIATEIMEMVGFDNFSVETVPVITGMDSQERHIFVHRLYIYPPGIAAVSSQ